MERCIAKAYEQVIKIGVSTLLSGGLLSHGSLGGYVADAARRSMGIGLAHFRTERFIIWARTCTCSNAALSRLPISLPMDCYALIPAT